MKYKEFSVDLAYSLEERDNEMFDGLYSRIFPGLARVELVTDISKQRLGIDKILHFSSGFQVTIDEKKRRTDYGDIALELRHEYDNGAKTKGWLLNCQCNYVVYAIMPSKKVYLLPSLLLKKAWLTHRREWRQDYEEISSLNRGYKTISLPIPTEVLLEAVSKEMRHFFD